MRFNAVQGGEKDSRWAIDDTPVEEIIEPLEDSSMRFDAVKGGGEKDSRWAIDDTPVPTREDFDDMAVDCEDCVNGRETSLVDVFGGDGKLARRQ